MAALYEGTLARNGLSRLDGQEEAQRLNRLGILHSSFGETLKANDAFASALKAKPDFYPAAINLANLCLLQGRLEQAGAYLARARELRPQSAAVEALARRLSVTPGPGAAVVAEPAAILAINGQAGASSIQRSSNTAAMPVWEE